MKLPKTVSIAGHKVKVIRAALDDCYGIYDHDSKTIRIDSSIDDRTIFDTLRHEMMEASLCLSGVGFCEQYEQEAVVRCMEEVFFPAYERVLKKIGLNPKPF